MDIVFTDREPPHWKNAEIRISAEDSSMPQDGERGFNIKLFNPQTWGNASYIVFMLCKVISLSWL
jgi:hypothetical protein